MQTSQVSNPANLLAAATQSGKPADASSADAFSQTLSREVAERGAAKEQPAAPRAEAAPAKQPESKPASAKKTEKEGEDGEEGPAPEAAQAQFSIDMLALVAAINSINTRTPAVPAATAGGEAALPAALSAGDPAFGAGLQAVLDDGRQAGAADDAGRQGLDLAQLGQDALRGKALAADGAGEAAPDFLAALQDSSNNINAAAPLAPQQALQSAQQLVPGADKLTPPVGTPAWNQALGQKVVWMVAGEQQTASLTLNPPDLGPLQVVLSVNNSHASATFSAAQPEVRQALEAALPKLREMLGEAGIQLGQASVNSGSPQQSQQQHGGAGHAPGHAGGNGNANTTGGEAQARISSVRPGASGIGLVDTFA